MKIKLIAIGKIKDDSIHNLISGYMERMSGDARIEVIELKDSDKESEGKRITECLEKIKDSNYIFALSEEGKEFDSAGFSSEIKKLSDEQKAIIFVIGGPFGLSESAKKKAGKVLSLSKMTFTHEMARLFLTEQIYRAISIIKNRSYHK